MEPAYDEYDTSRSQNEWSLNGMITLEDDIPNESFKVYKGNLRREGRPLAVAVKRLRLHMRSYESCKVNAH